MPTAKVDDISVYYETLGEGEALLLIMGYGSYSGHWFRLIPSLSNDYRVVAFDNRGTGQSDKPDIPYTIEMMAGDATGLLEAIGIDAAHVFGVSMGGMIAQEFALRYPGKVISLILGCTPGHCRQRRQTDSGRELEVPCLPDTRRRAGHPGKRGPWLHHRRAGGNQQGNP